MSIAPRHIAVVDAYAGAAEWIGGDADAHAASTGLGLPLDDICERIDARATILHWDDWLELERQGRIFTCWWPYPVTKPVEPLPAPPPRRPASARVTSLAIPPTDPEHGRSLAMEDPGRRSFGMIHQSDPLLYLSCRLEQELSALHRRDPFAAIVVPMWGGLGYLTQLGRATGLDRAPDVPIVVVVTDTSARRQAANEEGIWRREAVVRRQAEDLSLALADLVLAFGPRGQEIARRGRLADAAAPVRAVRDVPRELLDQLGALATPRDAVPKIRTIVMREPVQGASGTLAMMDAVADLSRTGSPQLTVHCAGSDTWFAPMRRQTFRQYWSSVGWAHQLMAAGEWTWSPHSGDSPAVRAYPSFFAHLPNIWSDLASGSSVLLSPAAAEGLAGWQSLPREVLIGGEPTPTVVAAALRRIASQPAEAIERARAALCGLVASTMNGPERERLVDGLAGALERLCDAPPPRQDLGRVSRLLLDRTRPLVAHDAAPEGIPPVRVPQDGRLTVVVTSFRLGPMTEEAVRSAWNADRVPDELLVIDDGSHDEPTMAALSNLEEAAGGGAGPLHVIRQANRGLAAARNTGLEAATGDFISFLDGDDLIDSRFYRIATALLGRCPALAGVAGWSVFFGEEGEIGHWHAPQPEMPFQLTENCVFVPAVVRTPLLRLLGGYDEGQRYNYEDWELSCQLLLRDAPIIVVPEYLQRYRVRPGSLYRTMTPSQHLRMRERMLARHSAAVRRWAAELLMLTEHSLMSLRLAPPHAAEPPSAPAPHAELPI